MKFWFWLTGKLPPPALPTTKGCARFRRLLAASSAEFDDDDDENEDAEAAPLLAAPRWNPAAAAHARPGGWIEQYMADDYD